MLDNKTYSSITLTLIPSSVVEPEPVKKLWLRFRAVAMWLRGTVVG